MTKNLFEQSNSYKHNGDLVSRITLSRLPHVHFDHSDLKRLEANWQPVHRLPYFVCNAPQLSYPLLKEKKSKRYVPSQSIFCSIPAFNGKHHSEG